LIGFKKSLCYYQLSLIDKGTSMKIYVFARRVAKSTFEDIKDYDYHQIKEYFTPEMIKKQIEEADISPAEKVSLLQHILADEFRIKDFVQNVSLCKSGLLSRPATPESDREDFNSDEYRVLVNDEDAPDSSSYISPK
jgi:hypothetical protein